MNPNNPVSRRDLLKSLGAGAALAGLGLFSGMPKMAGATVPSTRKRITPGQPFVLPPLPYAYDALEPYIDARTMAIHHDKHHQGYVNNANKALAGHADLQRLTGRELLGNLASVPATIRTAVRNNVGGHLNHSLFWRVIGPQGEGEPDGTLASAIDMHFGSFTAFKAMFSDAAAKQFGSGWAWLCRKGGDLVVHATANQDSPWSGGMQPILGLDVWEHAYYLSYQNRRADYIAAFWSLVNWEQVGREYSAEMT